MPAAHLLASSAAALPDPANGSVEMKYAVGQLQAARYMASGTDW
jgi:hypothetical protein